MAASDPGAAAQHRAQGGAQSAPQRRQARAQAKVDALVQACAELILEEGPTTVTHRAVAERAQVSLASTTYYFTSLDQMIRAAGRRLVADWVRGATDVLQAVRAAGPVRDAHRRAEYVVRAVLPRGDDAVVRGHYEHLVGAGRSDDLAAGYAAARESFDTAIGQLLDELGVGELPAATAVALVDGAAVAALSEGREVRPHAQQLLTWSLNRPASP